MKDNVVELAQKSKHVPRPPVTDYWFAQVDTRLSRIESYIKRLEWQIWMIVCGTAALLVVAVVQILAPTK